LLKKIYIRDKDFIIREFDPEKDSVEELTDLLHRAYKRLADMGLRFVATYQDEAETRQRMEKGECFVISEGSKLIGTVMLYLNLSSNPCEWYRNSGISCFGQFAVEPEYQEKGLGSRLMSFVEDYAKEKGAVEIALDTSEKAIHLIKYYKRRGYRFIQFHQWDRVNYRSVVLSKRL